MNHLLNAQQWGLQFCCIRAITAHKNVHDPRSRCRRRNRRRDPRDRRSRSHQLAPEVETFSTRNTFFRENLFARDATRILLKHQLPLITSVLSNNDIKYHNFTLYVLYLKFHVLLLEYHPITSERQSTKPNANDQVKRKQHLKLTTLSSIVQSSPSAFVQ